MALDGTALGRVIGPLILTAPSPTTQQKQVSYVATLQKTIP